MDKILYVSRVKSLVFWINFVLRRITPWWVWILLSPFHFLWSEIVAHFIGFESRFLFIDLFPSCGIVGVKVLGIGYQSSKLVSDRSHLVLEKVDAVPFFSLSVHNGIDIWMQFGSER